MGVRIPFQRQVFVIALTLGLLLCVFYLTHIDHLWTAKSHERQLIFNMSTAPYTEVEDLYYLRLEGVDVKCSKMFYLGRQTGAGGWNVCMTPAFKLSKPCLAYLFGAKDVWVFSEFLARDYRCLVRVFEPSQARSVVHWPGPVFSYNIGLGNSNRKSSNGWNISTFGTLMTMFGDMDLTLSLLKIDIEYSEWESLESMLATGILQHTKQLLLETHTNDLNNVVTSKKDYLRYHKILDRIEQLGFRRYRAHEKPEGRRYVKRTREENEDPIIQKSVKLKRSCCHELHYVNMRYAEDMTGLAYVKGEKKQRLVD